MVVDREIHFFAADESLRVCVTVSSRPAGSRTSLPFKGLTG
jgi:hypothetical protein